MLLKILEKLKNFVSPEKWETCLHKILMLNHSGSWRRDVPPRDERDERFRGMPRDIRLDEKEAERWKRGPDRGGDRPSDRDGPSRGPPLARSDGGGAAEGPWRRGGGKETDFSSFLL